MLLQTINNLLGLNFKFLRYNGRKRFFKIKRKILNLMFDRQWFSRSIRSKFKKFLKKKKITRFLINFFYFKSYNIIYNNLIGQKKFIKQNNLNHRIYRLKIIKALKLQSLSSNSTNLYPIKFKRMGFTKVNKKRKFSRWVFVRKRIQNRIKKKQQFRRWFVGQRSFRSFINPFRSIGVKTDKRNLLHLKESLIKRLSRNQWRHYRAKNKKKNKKKIKKHVTVFKLLNSFLLRLKTKKKTKHPRIFLKKKKKKKYILWQRRNNYLLHRHWKKTRRWYDVNLYDQSYLRIGYFLLLKKNYLLAKNLKKKKIFKKIKRSRRGFTVRVKKKKLKKKKLKKKKFKKIRYAKRLLIMRSKKNWKVKLIRRRKKNRKMKLVKTVFWRKYVYRQIFVKLKQVFNITNNVSESYLTKLPKYKRRFYKFKSSLKNNSYLYNVLLNFKLSFVKQKKKKILKKKKYRILSKKKFIRYSVKNVKKFSKLKYNLIRKVAWIRQKDRVVSRLNISLKKRYAREFLKINLRKKFIYSLRRVTPKIRKRTLLIRRRRVRLKFLYYRGLLKNSFKKKKKLSIDIMYHYRLKKQSYTKIKKKLVYSKPLTYVNININNAMLKPKTFDNFSINNFMFLNPISMESYVLKFYTKLYKYCKIKKKLKKKKVFFFNFRTKKLKTYRIARKTHWDFFSHKTLKGYRYQKFLDFFLKKTNNFFTKIYNYFQFKFKFSYQFWVQFNEIYQSFFQLKSSFKKILQLPIHEMFWRFLKFYGAEGIKSTIRLRVWYSKKMRIRRTFWMQQKKKIPKFLKKKNFNISGITNIIQYDFITNYFIVLKEFSNTDHTDFFIFKNKYIKLHGFKYNS